MGCSLCWGDTWGYKFQGPLPRALLYRPHGCMESKRWWGNRIRSRLGLPLLNKYICGCVWRWNSSYFFLISGFMPYIHVLLVPTFGICARPWSVSRFHGPWHLPRKGYKNPKKYDGPLDPGNQHSVCCFLLFPYKKSRIEMFIVYDAVSDRVLQVVLAVVNDQTFNWGKAWLPIFRLFRTI